MTERRHQNDVCISWIDNERANLAAVLQPHILPRFTGIDRFEDTGTVGGIAANGRFTCPSIDHIVIGWRDRDRTN